MDPLSLGIFAGANLLSTLGSSLFGASQQRQQQKQQAVEQYGQQLSAANQQEAEQKSQGLANLIAAYRSTLGGR